MLKILAKESAAYGFAKIVIALLGFITLPLFTRVFSTTEYGQLALILNGTALLSIFIALSMETAYSRYFNDDRFDRSQLFNAIFWFRIGYGLALVATSLMITYMVLTQLSLDALFPASSTAIAAAYLGQLSGLLMMVARMRHAVGHYLAISLTGTMLGTGCSVLFVIYQPTLGSFFAGLLVGNLVAMLIGFRILGIRPTLTPGGNRAAIRPILAFSLPLVPAGLSQYLMSSFDRWALATYLTPESVAVYTVGFKIASAMTLLTSVIMFAFLPHSMAIIQKDRAVASKELERLLRIFSLIACTGAIALTMITPFALPVLAPPAYADAAGLVGLFALANVFFSYTYFSTLGSLRVEKASDYSKAIGLGVLANIALNLALIPVAGALGAAVATVAAMALTAITSFVLSQLRYRFDYAFTRLFASSAITTLWVAISSGTPHVLPMDWSAQAGSGAVAMALLIAINVRRSDFERTQSADADAEP